MNWLASYIWPQQATYTGTGTTGQPSNNPAQVTTPQAADVTPKNAKTTPSKVLTPGSPQVRQRSSNNDNNQYENMNDFDQQVAQEEAKQKAVTDLKDQQNKFTVPKDANKKANPYDLNYDTLRLGPTDDQVFAKKGQQPPKGVDSEAAVILTIGSRKGAITINYHHYMIKDEDEEMSYEDAIKYLENRTKENLEIYNPETLADVEHIQKIIDFFKNKIVITWTSGAAAPVKRMLDIFMERSLFIEKNTIWFRYDQGNSYDERDGAEMLDLQSSSNSLDFQMYRVDGILYNQMLFYIEAAKNRNLTVKISLEEVEGGFEKLFADLGWPDEMANWDKENAGNREIKMYLEGDSNEYLINNNDHDD